MACNKVDILICTSSELGKCQLIVQYGPQNGGQFIIQRALVIYKD